jgi:hypothetical protein
MTGCYLIVKYRARLERLVRDIHSSLFYTSVNVEEISLITLATSVKYIKLIGKSHHGQTLQLILQKH